MENLEYVLLNEKINVEFIDISNTRDYIVISIIDVTHNGRSILDQVIKSQHFNHIIKECENKLNKVD